MAVTGIRWLINHGYDIHLVGGQTSRRLDEILVLDLDNGSVVFGHSPPAGVQVTFTAEFRGAPNNHGVTFNPDTGVVTAPNTTTPPPALRNFIIRADVTDPGATQIIEPISIRVHLHSVINVLRLTPDPLTIRPDADGFQLTLLAEFEDGTIGDITDFPGLTWSSDAPNKVSVDPQSGELKTTSPPGDSANIKVTLSSALGGNTAEAQVRTAAAWGQSLEVTWVNGKGKSKLKEAVNVLFVSEGFLSSEKTQFQSVVRSIVERLMKSRSTRPFDLFQNSVNYWMAFVPSSNAGVSVLPECYTRNTSDPLVRKGSALSLPVAPTSSPAATPWNFQELLHEIGLPVLSDVIGRPLEGGTDPVLPDLQTLYGSKVTRDRVQTLFPTWQGTVSSRVLLNELDTAFGLAQGERTRVEEVRESHWIFFNSRRMTLNFLFSLGTELETDLDAGNVANVRTKFQTGGVQLSKATVITNEVPNTRWLVTDMDTGRVFSVRDEGLPHLNIYENFTLKHFDKFLENLTVNSVKVGDTWSKGKDRGLVCFIARTGRKGGVNFGRYFSVSLGDEDEHNITTAVDVGSGQTIHTIDPMPIPSTVSTLTVATVAHETAHADQFGNLGDEYSNFGRLQIPEKRAARLNSRGNLQSLKALLVDVNNPSSGIDGKKIKWARDDVSEELWPRIQVAGVLKEKPRLIGPIDPVTGTQRNLEIILEPQHGKPFQKLDKDIVSSHLRARPLLNKPTLSSPMSIIKVNVDKIETRLFGGVADIDPDHFPAGSIILVPSVELLQPAGIRTLPIVARFIRDHITSTGKPLKSSRNVSGACVNVDQILSRTPDNLPPGIKVGKPKFRAWIAGLYEGGDTFNCNVFHSTGVCLMRWTRFVPGAAGQIYQFCHVCQYIMVDNIDPTKHGVIDQDYNARFPELGP